MSQVIGNGSDISKLSLEVKTKTGVKIIPPGKWWINRNTPVGEPADFYECKPHNGYKLLDPDKCKILY